MNTIRKIQHKVNIRCTGKVIQFPVKKVEIAPKTKPMSMSCRKTEMIDWNLIRGF